MIRERIRNKSARIGVIGLGYVGLPLAMEFARRGFSVTGFELDQHKVKSVNTGRSYITDVSDSDLKVLRKNLRATKQRSVNASGRWQPSWHPRARQ